jgi:hypothetical protein
MPGNAINGSLEVLAMLPQLEWMYTPTIICSKCSPSWQIVVPRQLCAAT